MFGIGIGVTDLPVRGNPYSASRLFANSEKGVWFDQSDLSTLFQDVAGTTPVTAPAQTVALALDKSQGLVRGPELVTNGDFSDGATGWTVPAGWSITGGAAVGAATSASLLGGGFSPVSSRIYLVAFDVVSYTSGTLYVSVGGNFSANPALTGAAMAPGQKAIYVISGANPSRGVEFYGGHVSATIDNISVRELKGHHATQATAAKRPTYGIVPKTGRRNLLTYTDFNSLAGPAGTQYPSGSEWSNFFSGGGTRTYTTSVIDPSRKALNISGVVAERNVIAFSFYPKASTTYTVSFWVEALDGPINTISYVTGALGAGGSTNYLTAPTVGERASFNFTTGTSPGLVDVRFGVGASTNDSGSLSISGLQLELGSTPTAYQKVVSQHEVTEAGVPSLHYLYKDPIDDSLIATLPDLGTNATVAYATEAGTTILTGQTIGAGAFEVLKGTYNYGLVVVDRPLTVPETANLTAYLDARRPT